MKHFVFYVITKGVSMAIVVGVVVANTSLSPFQRSLIIAGVSGLLGVLGIVMGAWISNRSNSKLIDIAQQNQKLSEEIKQLQKNMKGQVDAVANNTGTDTNNVAN